jgi:hypothetical protein
VGRIIDKPEALSEGSAQAARWLSLAETALRLWEHADDKDDDADHKPRDLPLDKPGESLAS